MSTARKTRLDSEPASLRHRAKASRASAARIVRGDAEAPAASPDLLALVAEWEENMRLQNEGSLSDEEAEPVINRGDEVQRAVLAYPVRSLTDLVAKIPVFRNELEHASGPKTPWGKEPLDYAAWVGVIRDIERLAPIPAGPVPAQCTAGQIADLMEIAARRWAQLDNASLNRVTNSAEETAVEDRIELLSTAISYARAASPGGMLGQLAVAFHAVDTAVNGAEHLRRPAMKTAERCLMSVAAALCAMTGITRDGYGAKHLMPARCDQLASLSAKVVR